MIAFVICRTGSESSRRGKSIQESNGNPTPPNIGDHFNCTAATWKSIRELNTKAHPQTYLALLLLHQGKFHCFQKGWDNEESELKICDTAILNFSLYGLVGIFHFHCLINGPVYRKEKHQLVTYTNIEI